MFVMLLTYWSEEIVFWPVCWILLTRCTVSRDLLSGLTFNKYDDKLPRSLFVYYQLECIPDVKI